jgi:peptide/nickel transport system permease protein
MSQPVSLLDALPRTLMTTLGVATLALALGISLGSAAGRKGGLYNDLLRRLIEFSGALPLVVALPLLSRVWPAEWSSIVVLGACHGLRLACIYRNETITCASRGFIPGLRSLGLTAGQTHWRHVFPMLLPLLITGALLTLPEVIGAEAALAYLGLQTSPTLGGYLVARSDAIGALALGVLVASVIGFHLLGQRILAHIMLGQGARLRTPCRQPRTD